jgi:hypothetical protein
VNARAWAADISPSSSSSSAGRHGYGNSVHVIREVHQQRNEKAGNEREEEGKEMKAWA